MKKNNPNPHSNTNFLRNSVFNFILTFLALQTFAANISITNADLVGQNTAGHYAYVQFDLAWDASWRTSTNESNWDAAWVFVKYRVGVAGAWQHATLSAVSGEHVPVAGATIDATAQGMGVFVYRDADGLGNNAWAGIKLRWNYGTDGVTDTDSVQLKVQGIEMVYVPQGSFYAGDNANSTASFKQGSTDSDPWYIGSEDALSVTADAGSGTGAGQTNLEYYCASAGNLGEDVSGSVFSVPAAFPKGYTAFYCQKYEISMGQYTDFLNLLTRTQQNTRTGSNVSTDAITNIYVMFQSATLSDRNTITCPASGNGTINPITFTTTTPDRACNFLSWMDGCAYADWAGLRPMTELEFEKACRGPLAAVSGEYAWGNTNIHSIAYTLTNDGTPNEGISNMNPYKGNAAYSFGAMNGPLRNGIFANSATNKTRQETGASYYGIMEMSGNLNERSITVGNATGRAYTGLLGNGLLSTSGNADVTNWAGMVATELTGVTGAGFRGGYWNSVATNLRTSYRYVAASTFTQQASGSGFRVVSSAP